ncbi:type I polyketide synthase [Amycolatopsis dendrobii]|nr:type I polyketide synthase [Amycolatopsis dendrobii]
MQDAIAITGMAGRFPGAGDVDQYWRNIRTSTESISFYTKDELRAEGFDEETLANPDFVAAGGELAGSSLFDAAYFGYSPREAELIDPQQRVFLECASAALERANVVPNPRLRVGVLGGAGMNTYLVQNVLAHPELIDPALAPQVIISNDKDYLALRVAYKLGLQGPALTVQTSCSSSLAAVHLGCRMLLTYDCDVVLAGGATVSSPQRRGYVYQRGGVASPDGHCRAFDARADGLAPGSGVGVVVLKRLEEALENRDVIHAVIRGSALNNDGSAKVGFTAPSVALQAEAVAEALASAGVDAASIGYVEAHGTATRLGDPIEVAALTRAFRRTSTATGFCALGSVKTNIGHLDAAAGVAGLIKTAMALRHRELPPSLNFEQPNPHIDFAGSPFFVNVAARPWEADGPRRAGVSAFGLGGTNVHVVLEEAPPRPEPEPSPWPQLLLSSARSPAALSAARTELADHLAARPGVALADVAHTLLRGRQPHPHRLATVAADAAEAIDLLRDPAAGVEAGTADLIFLFPGVTEVPRGAGSELYRRYGVFREAIDECRPQADVLFTGPSRPRDAAVATFASSYALARLLLSWGLAPRAMVGHSMGEYVAAVLAGVLPTADALRLVLLRYELLERIPSGAMLSVPLSEKDIRPLLREDLDVAAVNTAGSTVVSGPVAAIERLEFEAKERGADPVRLRVPVATHSALLEPVLGEFAAAVASTPFAEPRLPYVSSLTGTWADAAEVCRDEYWVRQFRETVRFADALDTLPPDAVAVEVGPGRALASLARAHGRFPCWPLLPTRRARSEMTEFLGAVGQLWQSGADLSAAEIAADETRAYAELPTYPFERQSYWLGAGRAAAAEEGIRYASPLWRRAPLQPTAREDTTYLVLADGAAGTEVARMLPGRVELVTAGVDFARGDVEDYVKVLKSLDVPPTDIVHAWHDDGGLLGQAYDALRLPGPDRTWRLVDRVHDVTGTEALLPGPDGAVDHTVDVDPADPAAAVREIGGGNDPVVAYRGVYRWTRSVEPVALTVPGESALRSGGLYVLSRDSAVFGEHLADRCGAKVVILDAGTETAMLRSIRDVRARHGAIDGVILPARLLDPYALAEALGGGDPLCILHSGPEIPAPIETAVRALNREGGRWLVVSWDGSVGPDDVGDVLERVAAVPEHGVLFVSRPGGRQRENAAGSPEEHSSRHGRPSLPTPYLAARNDIEAELVGIWEEVTGIAPLGVHDDFFALGGHSLMGTQVVARLRAAFGVDFPLARLFDSPTIAEMAQVVVRLAAEADDTGLEALLAEIELSSDDPAADG